MRTLASFRLFGVLASAPRAVTTRLGITPTRSAEVGDPISRRSPRRRDTSLWILQSAPAIEVGIELSEQLQRLLDQLLPTRDALWKLVGQGYEATWFCFVASNAAEHAVELDRSLLARLLDLPGDLWFDACGDERD